MRRLWCAAALSSAVLVLSACSSSSTDASSAPAAPAAGVSPAAGAPAPTAAGAPASAAAEAPASAATPAAGALGEDAKAICDQAARVGAEAGKTFAADRQILADAASSKDAAVAAQAKEKTSRDVQNYSDALVDMATLAGDPELKKALSGMGKKVAALKGDVRKLDAGKLADLRDDLAEACGTD
jgi:pyruvate/2-oxoglutarate dehydrogenase complex dihydrolipoamide acyltransferase (E2) component